MKPAMRERKAKLGQNFLVSPTAPLAIVEALGDVSENAVLEIGPGGGVLTRLLAQRARQVIAVELDAELAEGLRVLPVEVIHADILALDLTRLSHEWGVHLQIIGNLPYYISSPILMHLFLHSSVIDRAVLMTQREVAERIVASPGSREYGLLSAVTQMYASAEHLFTLPPEAFSPPPEVYSTVFRLQMQPRFVELAVDEPGFQRFLKQSFAQKRKTLVNNLRAAGYPPEQISSAIGQCKAQAKARAEAIELGTMACLYRALRAG